MKIVFIGGRNPLSIGGIESYTLNLATQLVRMGHEPVVFCESDHEGEEWVNGFRVIHQKSLQSPYLCKPLLGLRATWRTIRHMRDADFIHYNAWPPALWTPLARLGGMHTHMLGHGLEWQRPKYNAFQRTLIRIMEGYTAFINPTLTMCSDAQTRYFHRTYGRECTTIPSATNLPEPDAGMGSDILGRHGLRPQGYFLIMGRLEKGKNPDTLISAFRKLDSPDLRLVIAGEAPEQEFGDLLHSLAHDDPRVVFTGNVYDQDREALLSNAYSFCLPSASEGLSIALLEAMAHRVPVIVSDIPANRELLRYDSALWVSPGDVTDLAQALRIAIDDPERMARSVERNFNLVAQNYTWPVIAARYIDYLQALLSKKKC